MDKPESPPASRRHQDPASTSLVRPATMADTASLRSLMDSSVRELQKNDYSPEQLETALKTVFTVDTQLIADGTYFVIETVDNTNTDTFTNRSLIACGGWSRRRTLCGGDAHAARDHGLLNPETDAARIRAFFVHPAWARRGLGSQLLAHCEQAAIQAGFRHFEMAATLTGVPLYRARGYHVVEQGSVPLCGTSTLPVVIMARSVLSLDSRFSNGLSSKSHYD